MGQCLLFMSTVGLRDKSRVHIGGKSPSICSWNIGLVTLSWKTYGPQRPNYLLACVAQQGRPIQPLHDHVALHRTLPWIVDLERLFARLHRLRPRRLRYCIAP